MIKHHETEPMSPSRVVVLGATGFIGHEVCRQLALLEIASLPLSTRDIDLCSNESVNQLASLVQATDAVVFISALTPDRGRDIATLMRNLTMGQHVCAAFERVPCRHVVYISSDAVYDDNSSLLRSDSPCSPSTFHGVMHLSREVMLQTTLRQLGRPLLTLRPCAVFGVGDTHNSYGPNRFVRTALSDGKIQLFGNGEETRDHVTAHDVGRLVVEGLRRRSEGTLNVASGSSVSFHDVASLVQRFAGRPVEIATSARANPITHRHFDVADRIRAFPEFHPQSLEQGLLPMLSP